MRKVILEPDNMAAKYTKVLRAFREVSDCFYAELSPFPLVPRRGKVGVYLINEKGHRYLKLNKEAASEYRTHWLVWMPMKNWWSLFFSAPKKSIRLFLCGFEWKKTFMRGEKCGEYAFTKNIDRYYYDEEKKEKALGCAVCKWYVISELYTMFGVKTDRYIHTRPIPLELQ